MTDDFSDVSSATCYALSNSTTIYAYINGIRTSYYQIGGKWYRGNSQIYTNIPSGTYCYTSLDFSSNSQLLPIYNAIAFGLFLVAFIAFFYVIRRAFYALKVA